MMWRQYLGLGLLLAMWAGAVLLWFSGDHVWPVIFVVVGIAVYLADRRRSSRDGD